LKSHPGRSANWEGMSPAVAMRERRHLAAGVARSHAIRFVAIVIAATVLLMPFDAMVNISALGELAHDSYAIINLTLAPVVIFILISTGSFHVPRSLLIILSLILLVVFVTFVPNSASILDAFTKGRHGLGKLITSSMVPIFGMYISVLVYIVVSTRFRTCFLIPLLWSSVIVILGGLLQVSAKLFDPLRDISTKVFLITHAGFDRFDVLSNRLSDSGDIGSLRVTSTLFEPADFGTYAIYVLPWILAALLSTTFPRGRMIPILWTKAALLVAAILMLALAMFSGRTAALGAPAIVVIYVGVCLLLKISGSADGAKAAGLIMVAGAVLLYLLPLWVVSSFNDVLVQSAIASANTSNVSRLGTVVILLNLFHDHPLFGVGMGQYGFYVAQYLPPWANTFEFQRWLGDSNSSFFPSFAVFAKIAGEMGLVGLLVWVGFLVDLLRKVWRSIWAKYLDDGQFPYFGIAIAVSFFSLGLTGLGMASYRVFWIWALLGLGASYASDPSAIDENRNREA
jgi:hypothetical protein